MGLVVNGAMDQLKSRVLSVMKNDAVPIYVIAKEAGISLATASKYCHILQAEKMAEIIKFGNMKLVKKVMITSFENLDNSSEVLKMKMVRRTDGVEV